MPHFKSISYKMTVLQGGGQQWRGGRGGGQGQSLPPVTIF